MDKYIIKGPTKLEGEVKISGAKNAALAIVPACILIDGVCTLENIPNISDIRKYYTILEELGAKVDLINENKVKIDKRNIKSEVALSDNVKAFRASYYLIGALLSKFKYAKVAMPGGCKIGKRPIDMHLKAFEDLGAEVVYTKEYVEAKADKLVGTEIVMKKVSVGATMNTILASIYAEGKTIIRNAAEEPHVVDLCNFLNKAGAKITGMGTKTIEVEGIKKLQGDITYSIVPDQIEASTFIIAAVATNGNVKVSNCIPEDQKVLIDTLKNMGANVEIGDNFVNVKSIHYKIKGTDVETMPHPGFATDIQSQFGVLLSVAEGKGSITEKIWEGRFKYIDELNKMGVKANIKDKTAHFEGNSKLHGAEVVAPDLRAGAALIIAGNIAKGTTEVTEIQHIDRGYEKLDQKFRNLGSNIERVESND